MKAKAREKETRWLDYIILAVGEAGWKSIFEVRERLDQLLPPHAVYRLAPDYYHRGSVRVRATIHSKKLTVAGTSTRYGVRAGLLERSVPIRKDFPNNLGNHYLRLTPKGKDRLHAIKFYQCADCLNTGLKHIKSRSDAKCGHCRSHNLKFYTPPGDAEQTETKQTKKGQTHVGRKLGSSS